MLVAWFIARSNNKMKQNNPQNNQLTNKKIKTNKKLDLSNLRKGFLFIAVFTLIWEGAIGWVWRSEGKF